MYRFLIIIIVYDSRICCDSRVSRVEIFALNLDKKYSFCYSGVEINSVLFFVNTGVN